MSDEVLVKAEGVSKKFCRSLKRSLWYGVQDVANEALGCEGHHDELRKNEFWAVNDISFELKRGECLGLIGPNGAGKSTLLKLLNGLVKPDKGRITMRGRVGALIELGAGFNPILTGRENVYVNGSVLGFTKKEIDSKFDEIVDFAEIEEFIDSPVQNYSSGMKVRLGFAVAAQMGPDVLLIDEVLAVGDPGFVAKCLHRIGELMKTSSLILVTHSMPNIFRLATHVLTLNLGRTSYSGADVASGIENLHSLFHFDKKSIAFNTSLATLTKLEVEGPSLGDIGKLNYGDELVLHVYCEVDTKIPTLSVNILIFDRNENPLLYTSSELSGLDLVNRSKSRHLRVNLGALLLTAGLYSIDVSISDKSNLGVLAQVKGICRFQMCSRYVGYAPMQKEAIWEWV